MTLRGLLILLMLPVIAASQQQYFGTTASSVRLSGEADPADLQRLAIRAGDVITTENIRASIQALYDTGRYRYVEVAAEPAPGGGTQLDFRVQAHFFFSTFRMVPEDLLERPLSAYVRIPVGERYSTAVVDRIGAELSRLLEDEGYFNTSIKPETMLDVTTRLATVTLHVAHQPQARIGKIQSSGGEETLSPEGVRDALGMKTGEPFTADKLEEGVSKVREEFANIEANQGFLNARVNVSRQYHPSTNTVDLNITIDPGQFILVQTRGYDVPRRRLRELIPIFEERTVDPDLLEEGLVNIRDYMHQQGYFEATARYERIEVPLDPTQPETNNAVQINYIITPGEQYKIGEVRIEGNTRFTDREIKERMKIRSAGLLGHGSFSQDLLAEDHDAIVSMYRNAGFEGTEVIGDYVRDAANRRIDVIIRIREGSQSPIKDVRFSGNSAVSEAELRRALPFKEGETYTPVLVTDARRSLMELYYGKGFSEAQVQPAVDVTPDGASITFNISEGAAYKIGKIMVAGNTLTAEKIVHRNTEIYPNTPYNPEAILGSQQCLYATGLFNRVEIVPLQRDVGAVRDLLIQVEDARPVLVTYGIGAQELKAFVPGPTGGLEEQAHEVVPRGTIEVSHNNLWGLDRTLTTRLRGTLPFINTEFREEQFIATYEEPRLFNRNLQGYGSFLIERRVRRNFDTQSADVSLQIVKRIPTPGCQRRRTAQKSFFFLADFEIVDLQNLNPSIQRLRAADEEGVVQVARLGASFVGDWRDDPINPSKGNYTTNTFQIADRAWGSEVNFVNLYNQWTHYKPTRAGVIATALRVGWKPPYGGDVDLPIFERYFAGGSTTLRGYSFDEAGPLGGGQLLTIANIEYRAPLRFLPTRNFEGAAFYDTGNVFLRASDFSWGGPRGFSHTVGAGIRYRTPVGPVRLDVGYLLNRKVRPQPDEPPNADGTFPVEIDERVHVFFTLGYPF